MAQQNVIVRLSLKDQDVVRRGLEQLGADGEKALKRIEAAGAAAVRWAEGAGRRVRRGEGVARQPVPGRRAPPARRCRRSAPVA